MKRIIAFASFVLFAAAFASCDKMGTGNSNEDPQTPESEIPVIPEDPQENSTDFKHRMLMVQHTGTGCGYCPFMMAAIKEFSEIPENKGSYNLVVSHAFNNDDLAATEDSFNLSELLNPAQSFPALTFNLSVRSVQPTLESIQAAADKFRKEAADVGIAAASSVSDNKVTVNVEIKSAIDTTYRISVWLLRDNIYAKQKDYNTGVFEDWMHTHNNCLTKMSGNGLQTKIYGRNIGKVAAGEKMTGLFRIDLDSSWNADDCKVIITANSKDETGSYDVWNSAICPVNGSISYEYNPS